MCDIRAKFIKTVTLEPGEESFTLTPKNTLN